MIQSSNFASWSRIFLCIKWCLTIFEDIFGEKEGSPQCLESDIPCSWLQRPSFYSGPVVLHYFHSPFLWTLDKDKNANNVSFVICANIHSFHGTAWFSDTLVCVCVSLALWVHSWSRDLIVTFLQFLFCIVTDVTVSHTTFCNTTKGFLRVGAVNGCAFVFCTESALSIYVSATVKSAVSCLMW